MESPPNPPPYFPNLRFEILELYAKRWVRKYPSVPIERVILYGYSPLYPHATKGVPVKYAVVFEITDPQELFGRAIEQYQLDREDFSICEYRKIMTVEVYNDLVSATEYYQTVREEYPFSEFIDARFFDVYRQSPAEDFRDDWIFIPKVADKDSVHQSGKKPRDSIMFEEPHWILYQWEPPSQEDAVKWIIKEVRREIDLLYAAVKRVGFSGRAVNATEVNWQYAALDCFDSHKDEFDIVRREYLEDKGIYLFSNGKERRDFIGKLLQRIMEERGLGRQSYAHLYELFRLTDKPTKLPTKYIAQ